MKNGTLNETYKIFIKNFIKKSKEDKIELSSKILKDLINQTGIIYFQDLYDLLKISKTEKTIDLVYQLTLVGLQSIEQVNNEPVSKIDLCNIKNSFNLLTFK